MDDSVDQNPTRKRRRAVASANSYLRFFGGDYLRDTMHLTAAQDGIYVRLLLHYWHSQRPLPADPQKLEGIARVRDDLERAALDAVLREFFPKRGKLRFNKRMDSEIEASRQYSRKQAEAGKVGGKKSAESKKTRQANAEQASSEAQGSPKRPSSPTNANASKGGINPIPPLDPPGASGSADAAITDLAGERPAKPEPPTSASEAAYRAAIAKRYGTDPGPCNKKQRGQLAMLLTRVPRDDAPAIVAHYVSMDGQRGNLYASARHPIDLLLRDCESIRLAWMTKDVASAATSGPPWYRVEYPQRTEEFCKRGRELGLPVPTRGSSSDDWTRFYAEVWVRAEPGRAWHDPTNAAMVELVEQARASLGHLRRVK